MDEALQKHYWKKNQKLVFPILWERKKGLYASSIRVNYVDKTNKRFGEFMRTKNVIDDINMFVTSFVLLGQL